MTYTKSLAGATPANRSIQSTKHRQAGQALEDAHVLAEALDDKLRRAMQSAKHRQDRDTLKRAHPLAEVLKEYLHREMGRHRADPIGPETA